MRHRHARFPMQRQTACAFQIYSSNSLCGEPPGRVAGRPLKRYCEVRQMTQSFNTALIVGACLSAIAAMLHVAIFVGGPAWYRFFGAGEGLAKAAEKGRWHPAIITLGIAAVPGIWSAYALSGAGVLVPLPFLKLVLCIITGVYLLRGLAVVPFMLFAQEKTTPFIFWSSIICVLFGVAHLIGLA
jgi:hypothetical protein